MEDRSVRSLLMSRIHRRDTKPELAVRSALFADGYRFRVDVLALPGSPDIVLRKYRAAVFVHGCFWHRHACRPARLPRTNSGYWRARFRANRRRDGRVVGELLAMSWRVCVVWECELRNADRRQVAIRRIERWLGGRRRLLELSTPPSGSKHPGGVA